MYVAIRRLLTCSHKFHHTIEPVEKACNWPDTGFRSHRHRVVAIQCLGQIVETEMYSPAPTTMVLLGRGAAVRLNCLPAHFPVPGMRTMPRTARAPSRHRIRAERTGQPCRSVLQGLQVGDQEVALAGELGRDLERSSELS